VPGNTSATVFVPTREPATVSESGQPAAEAAGVRLLRLTNHEAVYRVGSGHSFFRALAVGGDGDGRTR
jgi:alpha-L-rhamnosidase